MKSVFDTLSAINVNDKVEKKNNLTYLSWAWAWGETKKLYPNATYNVIRDPQTDKPYFSDNDLGIMVMTSVTIDGEELEMWLPVMNHRNQALTIEQATMFDVNKTIMRCLTKNLAMFGLGHYIYAGEDLPEADAAAKKEEAKEAQAKQVTLKVDDENWEKVLKYIVANKEMGLEKIINQISKKYKVTAVVKKAINELIK